MTDEKRRPRPAAQYGPVAQAVARNVERIRKIRNMTIYSLSGELDKVGRPIAPSAIAKIERQQRQVTVDDLVALAVALNTAPIALLLPSVWGDSPIELTSERRLAARTAWRWVRGLSPASDYGVNPAEVVVGSDDDEWEDELDRKYWQLRQDYDAVTLPPELRRVRQHPASRDADAVTLQTERLIRMAGGKAGDDAFEDQLARARGAVDRLATELERLSEERTLRRSQAGGSGG
ncbi:helix-turn-helix domain-containing protein [Streptomyces hokutonensis]|uniref:helix-turn-helix domain-containing protein n=1 Tax=Streptomyces hokutonensis TaxID=1306990 RepID=UPI0003A72E0B|nr:helix-turn-helix transcriptional regulator [Streptomyces hokutonensis]